MAQVEADGSDPSKPSKLVCFYLDGQEFAAPIDEVKETMQVRPITRVFLTPDWLAGIINLRGDVVAVLDLGLLMGLRPTPIDDQSRIVIIQWQSRLADERLTEQTVGILVDYMAELRVVELDQLQPPPATLTSDSAAILRGILTVDGTHPLRVLDLPTLMRSERVQTFRHRAATSNPN